MSNDQEWFYLDGEESKGPFSLEAMRQLLQAGVIRPDSWVASNGASEWKAVGSALEQSAIPHLGTEGSQPAANSQENPPIQWDRRPLIWAAMTLGGFFVALLVSSLTHFSKFNPDPTNVVFAWPRVTAQLIWLFVVAAVSGAVPCWPQYFRLKAKAMNRKPSYRATQLLVWSWIGAISVSLWLVLGSPLSNQFRLLIFRYLRDECGLETIVSVSLLFVAVIAGSTFVSERVRRQLAASEKTSPTPPLSISLARNWVILASLLSILILIQGAGTLAIGWPPLSSRISAKAESAEETNRTPPDATTQAAVENLIAAIKSYQASHSNDLARAWSKLPPEQKPDEPFDPLIGYGFPNEAGDIVGTAEGKLLRLLGLPGGEILNASQQTGIKDSWGQTIQVALDGNGDGKIQLGSRRFDASILIWSYGPNGSDDNAGADDLGWLWR